MSDRDLSLVRSAYQGLSDYIDRECANISWDDFFILTDAALDLRRFIHLVGKEVSPDA